MFKKESVLIIL
jgi:malignant T-cell-amplified sequence